MLATFFLTTSLHDMENIKDRASSLHRKYAEAHKKVEDLKLFEMPEATQPKFYSENAENILYYILGGLIFLSVVSLLMPSFGKFAAILWFVVQLFEHEVLNLMDETKIELVENVLLSLVVFLAAMVTFRRSCK